MNHMKDADGKKLTKIELESKEKIKKNQDKLERTLDDLTYNDGNKLTKNDKKKYINNPDELLNILKNNKDVSYEEKKLEENIRKIKKHKGIVESSQRKQKELDQSLAKKMSNRVEEKTDNIEKQEKSLKDIEKTLEETKLKDTENNKFEELSMKKTGSELSNDENNEYKKLIERRKESRQLLKKKIIRKRY